MRLRKLILREGKGRFKIRLLAIKLSYEGRSVQDIADILSKTRQSIATWIYKFNESGIDGIKDSNEIGRPKILDEDIIEEVKKN